MDRPGYFLPTINDLLFSEVFPLYGELSEAVSAWWTAYLNGWDTLRDYNIPGEDALMRLSTFNVGLRTAVLPIEAQHQIIATIELINSEIEVLLGSGKIREQWESPELFGAIRGGLTVLVNAAQLLCPTPERLQDSQEKEVDNFLLSLRHAGAPVPFIEGVDDYLRGIGDTPISRGITSEVRRCMERFAAEQHNTLGERVGRLLIAA